MTGFADTPRADPSYGVYDIPYLPRFHAFLAPAFLDHVALTSGFAPPARDHGFSWCDLGCGQGVSAVMLAATHPQGRFFGLDANPAHIDHARRFAAAASVPNVRFVSADFSAPDFGEERFDYIVCHGVYSWVDGPTQRQLRQLIDRRLAPGGLVYVSYNAMPGWAGDLAFQRLLHDLARALPGTSAERFSASFEVVQKLRALGVPALKASGMMERISARPASLPLHYLSHELMVNAWRPLWVTEVRQSMAEIGFAPIGSATLMENYDSFVLGARAREALAGISDDNGREIARDLFINQNFRRDVFARAAPRLDEDERRRRLIAATFALTRPPSMIDYEMRTAAGLVKYDNGAARAIISALEDGPLTIGDIARDSRHEIQDLLANTLVLCAEGCVRPVEGGKAPVSAINQAILARRGGSEQIGFLAMPFGTAVALDDAVMAAVASDSAAGDEGSAAWRKFLGAFAPSGR